MLSRHGPKKKDADVLRHVQAIASELCQTQGLSFLSEINIIQGELPEGILSAYVGGSLLLRRQVEIVVSMEFRDRLEAELGGVIEETVFSSQLLVSVMHEIGHALVEILLVASRTDKDVWTTIGGESEENMAETLAEAIISGEIPSHGLYNSLSLWGHLLSARGNQPLSHGKI